jgi:hypothetical protein
MFPIIVRGMPEPALFPTAMLFPTPVFGPAFALTRLPASGTTAVPVDVLDKGRRLDGR